jgi:hypothetical protein
MSLTPTQPRAFSKRSDITATPWCLSEGSAREHHMGARGAAFKPDLTRQAVVGVCSIALLRSCAGVPGLVSATLVISRSTEGVIETTPLQLQACETEPIVTPGLDWRPVGGMPPAISLSELTRRTSLCWVLSHGESVPLPVS